jgi:Flp pilus assembly protein TadD
VVAIRDLLSQTPDLRGEHMSDAYELYQEGRARLREGMAAQATVALERAKRLEPEKASIREALGIAYYRITRWEAAEAEFRKVLELSPVDAYAHFALGRSLEKQGRREEAARHLKLASVLERRPDAPSEDELETGS